MRYPTCNAYVGNLVNRVDMKISRLDGKALLLEVFSCVFA